MNADLWGLYIEPWHTPCNRKYAGDFRDFVRQQRRRAIVLHWGASPMGRVCWTRHIPDGDPADRQFSLIIAIGGDARCVRAVTPNKSATPARNFHHLFRASLRFPQMSLSASDQTPSQRGGRSVKPSWRSRRRCCL